MEVPWFKNFRKAPVLVITLLVLLLVLLFYGSQQNVVEEFSSSGNLNERNQGKQQQTSINVIKGSAGLQSHRVHTAMKIGDTVFKPFSISKTDDEFMNAQAEIQQQRKKTLRAVCDRYFSSPSQRNIIEYPNRFIVDKENKLLYCSVAKVASTNWRLVFEKLAGIVGFEENAEQTVINRAFKRRLTFLDDLSPSEADRAVGESLKFMFARNPFSRVLSSYRNKLDPHSTFKRANMWQKVIGLPIMKQYREGTGPWEPRIRQAMELLPGQKYDLKFSEFMRFLGDSENQENVFYANIHWSEIYRTCSPCNIDYDVIGKLETIEDDAKYIFKLAKLDNRVQFLSPKSSNPTFSFKNETLEHYLEDVPAEDIRDLYRRYQIDFKLFGYELPPNVVKILEEGHMTIF